MYKLSNLAAEDIAQIYEYTLLNFGVSQADKYMESLEKTSSLISSSPKMGYEYLALGKDIRCHNHQRHSIFYQQRKQDIFILRLLHQSMDTVNHTFEL